MSRHPLLIAGAPQHLPGRPWWRRSWRVPLYRRVLTASGVEFRPYGYSTGYTHRGTVNMAARAARWTR